MGVLRKIAPAVVLIALISMAVRTLMVLDPGFQWVPSQKVFGTRMLAVAFLFSDLVISLSLVTLLLVWGRRPPDWVEQRLPFRGRWLWPLLLVLTLLSYAGLAPTFLFLLVQVQRS